MRALAEEAALGLGTLTKDPDADVQPPGLRAAVARYEAEHIRAALT